MEGSLYCKCILILIVVAVNVNMKLVETGRLSHLLSFVGLFWRLHAQVDAFSLSQLRKCKCETSWDREEGKGGLCSPAENLTQWESDLAWIEALGLALVSLSVWVKLPGLRPWTLPKVSLSNYFFLKHCIWPTLPWSGFSLDPSWEFDIVSDLILAWPIWPMCYLHS